MSFSVIIPSRTDRNLHACVDAIRAAGETCRVIVVDDGLKDRRADCVYVKGVKPFVYARNCNLGIAACGPGWIMNPKPCQLHEVHIQSPGEDVILLNDDALLKTPMGFTRMAEEAADYPYVGIVSAVCNNVGNVNQHPRQSTHQDSGLCDWCSGDSRDDQHGCNHRLREEERMVCFISVFIKRSTIDKVGLLDERYVKYGLDDDDYCFRVRHAGLSIGIFDHCFVDHSELTSTFRGGPADAGDFKPNLRLFIAKWGHDNRGLPKEQSPWRELFT